MRLTIQTRHTRCGSRLLGLVLLSLAGLLVAAGSVTAQTLTESGAGPIYCAGAKDNFVCPSEPTTPSPALSTKLVSQYADADPLCFQFLDFDEFPGQLDCGSVQIPKSAMFMHSMTFSVPGGGFTAANLTFRVKGASTSKTGSDYIAFFEGATYVTGANLSQLPGAGGTWNPNQDVTFTLDLAGLPGDFEVSNILSYLNDGDLDIVIGTGTAVDWICLQDCACDCHSDPQCDGLTNVLDVVHAVNFAFKGAPPVVDPNAACPWITTDVDCSGFTNVLDVVKFVNVAFRGETPASQFCSPCAP